MEHFTPLASFIGGVLIGLAAVSFLYFNGKICGISGIFGGLLTAKREDTAWRVLFLAGLMGGAVFMMIVYPEFFVESEVMLHMAARSELAIIVGGLMVGIGVRLGNGCTSGHGVCGIGRMAPRSIVATFVFMAFGVTTAVIVNHVFAGSI